MNLIRSDIEPTKEMIDAAWECDYIQDSIKAALAAAPKVEIDDQFARNLLARFKAHSCLFSDEALALRIFLNEALEAALTAPETNRG